MLLRNSYTRVYGFKGIALHAATAHPAGQAAGPPRRGGGKEGLRGDSSLTNDDHSLHKVVLVVLTALLSVRSGDTDHTWSPSCIQEAEH